MGECITLVGHILEHRIGLVPVNRNEVVCTITEARRSISVIQSFNQIGIIVRVVKDYLV